MADHHNARDECSTCEGVGSVPLVTSESVELRTCPSCKGSGLSYRNTYRHALGRALTEGNAGAMQWGDTYRQLHRDVMRELRRVSTDGALVVWNVKNHLRGRREQLVVEWHLNEWLVLGCKVLGVIPVSTPGQRYGANGALRLPHEMLLTLRLP